MDERLFTTPEGRTRLEGELLPRWLPSQRWFGGKARTLRGLKIAASERLGGAWLLAIAAEYADGCETYAVPLALSRDPVEAVVAEENCVRLFDATHSPEFRAALFRVMADAASGPLCGERGRIFASLFPDGATPESRVLKAEQSNTSLIYGGKLFVKLYRKLVPGENPDAEMTRFLSERAGFAHVPAFGGAVEWNGASLALATNVIANDGDAWTLALREAGEFLNEVGSLDACDFAEAADRVSPRWTRAVSVLGRRIGEMHRVLAAENALSGFVAEAFTPEDGHALIENVQIEYGELLASLRDRHDRLPAGARVAAARLLELGTELRDEVGESAPRDAGVKIRTHGDLHLGQILCTGTDFVILDFEGEPARSLDERRMKQSPLRDVAGMVRSFHYAALAGRALDAEWADFASTWATASQSVFVSEWKAAVGPTLATTSRAWESLGRLFVIQKALYEARYELNNRPDWLHIPLRGLLALA